MTGFLLHYERGFFSKLFAVLYVKPFPNINNRGKNTETKASGAVDGKRSSGAVF